MSKENKRSLRITKFELVWYIICGVLGLWGIVYIILGLVATNINIPSAKNDLLAANNSFQSIFGLGFFGWGLILLSIGAVAAVIVLCVYARGVDRDYEKQQRRAARLNRIKDMDSNDSDVFDAEVK